MNDGRIGQLCHATALIRTNVNIKKKLISGCTFIGFYDVNFSGASTQLRGPAVIPQSPGFDYMVGQDRVVKGFRSWYSQCGITYINCQPEDRFEVIFSCDNIGGQVIHVMLNIVCRGQLS